MSCDLVFVFCYACHRPMGTDHCCSNLSLCEGCAEDWHRHDWDALSARATRVKRILTAAFEEARKSLAVNELHVGP